MVIKINYTSSDVYVSTSVSPVYVVVNYSAVNNGGGGTVSSVGLTMPSAFSVANSPVTSSGTLAVTGAGTASQYVRGDGQLANFPDNGGGGSAFNYYLNGSVTQGTFGGTTYYEMSKTPVLGAGTNFTRTNAQGNGYIASFITDAGDPSLLNIPGGNWNVEFYFASSASGGSPQFYGELYKVSSADVFTLVASGSSNPEGITNGTTIDQYFTSIPVPQTSLLVTDRLAIRIYVIPAGRTITLHTENSNLCEVLTTFSTGLNALNGLAAQVQYFATGTSGTDFAISSATDTHTFNLPTASATNRGALSSADWTSFNGRVPSSRTLTINGTSFDLSADRSWTIAAGITGSGTSGQVAYWNGTSSQTGSNNLFWDAANSRLGIGTNAPVSSLDVNGISVLRGSSSYFGIYGTNGTGGTDHYIRIPDLDIASFNPGISFYANGVRRITLYRGGNDQLFTRISGTDRMALFATGNLVLQNGGTFTDGGQRLQVMGDAFIKGSGATSATTALSVQNSSGLPIFVALNNRTTYFSSTSGYDGTVEINTPANRLAKIGAFEFTVGSGPNWTGTGIRVDGANRCVTLGLSGANTTDNNALLVSMGGASGQGFSLRTSGTIEGALFDGFTFAPTSGTATFTQFVLRGTVNQTGGANGITRGLYVNPTLTAAADWRSIEWSNNSGWGLYGAGTAPNQLNGVTTIRTSSSTDVVPLQVQNNATLANFKTVSIDLFAVNGDARILAGNETNASGANGYLALHTRTSEALTEKLRIFSNGNVLIQTGGTFTNAGFKLDVNGTARVSGAVTAQLSDNAGSNNNLLVQTVNGDSAILRVQNNEGGVNISTNNAVHNFTDTATAISIQTGNVGVRIASGSGGVGPAASAMLDVISTTRGFLPPRMTTTQKNAISSPAAGLQVYDTTLNQMSYYNGTTWVNF